MCGRFDFTASKTDLLNEYGGIPAVVPSHSYNIYPSCNILTIRCQAGVGRVWANSTWGLVPHWSETPTVDYDTKNAVGETLLEKPAYRDAFRSWRCLIPITGFYEWAKSTGQPYRITSADGGLLTLAGLYSVWRKGAVVLDSCTIVTTTPNAVMEPIHHRMPVILSPADYDTWLEPSNSSTDQLSALLHPCDDSMLRAYKVSRHVNTPSNNDVECIAPI